MVAGFSLLTMTGIAQVQAQQPFVIGAPGGGGITINQSVLDELARPAGQGASRLPLPGAMPNDAPVVLRPPGQLALPHPSNLPQLPIQQEMRMHPSGQMLPVAPPLASAPRLRLPVGTPTQRMAPAQTARAPQLQPLPQTPVTQQPAPIQPTTQPSYAPTKTRKVTPELIVVPPPPAVAQPAPPPAPAKKTAAVQPKRVAPPVVKKAVPAPPPVPAAPAPAKKVAPPPPPPPAPAPAPVKKAPPPPPPVKKAAPAPVPKVEVKKAELPPPAPAPRKSIVATPKKAEPQPQKQTALQPPTAPIAPLSPGVLASVPFAAGSETLSNAGSGELSAIAAQLAETGARLQLKAYASANGASESAARRLSLTRALKVRSHLIRNGVASTRIDVRALGIAKDGAPDRVDVLVLKRK